MAGFSTFDSLAVTNYGGVAMLLEPQGNAVSAGKLNERGGREREGGGGGEQRDRKGGKARECKERKRGRERERKREIK